jgi:hypothetical protein
MKTGFFDSKKRGITASLIRPGFCLLPWNENFTNIRAHKNGPGRCRKHQPGPKQSRWWYQRKSLMNYNPSGIMNRWITDARGCFLLKRKGGQEQTRENQAKNDSLSLPAELNTCRYVPNVLTTYTVACQTE